MALAILFHRNIARIVQAYTHQKKITSHEVFISIFEIENIAIMILLLFFFVYVESIAYSSRSHYYSAGCSCIACSSSTSTCLSVHNSPRINSVLVNTVEFSKSFKIVLVSFCAS